MSRTLMLPEIDLTMIRVPSGAATLIATETLMLRRLLRRALVALGIARARLDPRAALGDLDLHEAKHARAPRRPMRRARS